MQLAAFTEWSVGSLAICSLADVAMAGTFMSLRAMCAMQI